jgi:hypothetical protein
MNQIVIIGGGSSISEGVNLGLWEKLENRWTLGCNSVFKFFTPTALTFVDHRQFYKIFYPELKDLPFMIGKYYDSLKPIIHPNTVLLKDRRVFDPTLQIKAVYCGSLCGLFSMTLACYFMKQVGEIYLLGFDFGAVENLPDGKAHTHFYQGKVSHPGIGMMGYYKRPGKVRMFEAYTKVKKVKIYNVSQISTIPYFEKISYDTFFEKLNMTYDQEEMRTKMKEDLKEITC